MACLLSLVMPSQRPLADAGEQLWIYWKPAEFFPSEKSYPVERTSDHGAGSEHEWLLEASHCDKGSSAPRSKVLRQCLRLSPTCLCETEESVDNPIQVEALRKSYGSFPAVKGIDFEVRAGEVFGMLGPNGAGKTTTVEILEGLRTRSGGRVSVLGCDPEVQTRQLKDRVGVCLQDTNLQEKLLVCEAMELFASFYTRTVDGAQLLKRLQLWEKRNAPYAKLSGGQKQRLALALALLNDPQVLFLDEPSAGLDPQARLEIHELVLDLRREQRTILMTTHYIEEAEKLCDRVAIVDEGRIVAMGTPREIQERALAHSTIEIEWVHRWAM